jgi:serine/threonine protein kinase
MANMALEEVKSLIKMEHGNIVRYRDFFLEDDGQGLGVCFAMEYCSNGDLWTQVEAYGPPCSDVACTWMWQISSALDFLHNMHVIHRDLKPNNVLLDQHLTCKVADFGLARVFDEEGQVRSQVGTIMYRAPEILHNRTYTEKVDMWALGCTMHSCLTHTLRSINVEAYSNPNLMQEVTDELKKGGYPGSLISVIMDLLNVVPEQRPSASSVKSRIEQCPESPKNMSVGRPLGPAANTLSPQSDASKRSNNSPLNDLMAHQIPYQPLPMDQQNVSNMPPQSNRVGAPVAPGMV